VSTSIKKSAPKYFQNRSKLSEIWEQNAVQIIFSDIWNLRREAAAMHRKKFAQEF
jgi:hypothetical protein